MRYLVFTFSLLFFLNNLRSQTLYMPRDIKAAYKNGTRSMDGLPGKKYWQNHARYDIAISALPPDRTIKGTETISYVNNSTDTLGALVFKLFLNIHKPGVPRDQSVNADYLTDGMHIDSYTINGKKVNWRDNPNLDTWEPQRLPAPLLPKDSVQVSIDWHYQISLQSNREGMIDSTTYFLAYFYPRIAVYDDYAGWDVINFVDSKEFYSDFNDYTVTLTVPKNFIVWGTGTLQKPETVLQPEYLKRFNSSMITDEVVRIVTKDDLSKKNITAQQPVNSWQFKATNIPDMTFALSDHFVWDATSTIVDETTKRRAGAQAAYNDTAADYHSMASYAQHALKWFSSKENWPGIPYPYEKTTVVHGYAGMEYPMMVNDETYSDTTFSRFVAEHEIAHTYMPFYMGINESRYGFMDEGWATTLELLIGRSDLGVEKAEGLYKNFRVDGWINDPSSEEDLPIIIPTNALTGVGLGNNEYGKASLGYLAMKDLLGDDLFRKCLHAYMNNWHGKHPIPWDFFYIFNTTSAKNLNWFWNSWYFTYNYIDLSIKDVKTAAKGSYTVTIDNIGGMPAPVDVIAEFADGTTQKFHQTPAIWQKNEKQAIVTIKTTKKVTSISLDGGIFMDADEANNSKKF